MNNSTKYNVFVYRANKRFLGTDFSHTEINPKTWYSSPNVEVNIKELLKGTKVGFDEKTNEFTIKVGGQKFVTKGLYHIGERNQTHYFKDKESGKFYFIRDGKISKPYADFLYIKNDKNDGYASYDEISYGVLDEDGRVLKISSKLNESDTKMKYISDLILQNEDGKFAYANDGEPKTDFIFDTMEVRLVKKTNDYALYIDDKNTLFITGSGKKIAEVPKFNGKIQDFNVTQNELGQILANDGYIYVDMENGKILHQSNVPAKNSYSNINSFVSANDGKSVYVEKQVEYKDYKRKVNYVVKEIPYTACGLKNGCIEAKDKNGKCGIVSKTGEVVLDFKYDDFGIESYENRTAQFLPIMLNGKMGVFNTETKRVEIEPFCKKVLLDDHNSVGRVSGDLYHFVFEGENGKCGLVNNKGHIVIEPVLTSTNLFSGMFSEDNHTYRQFVYKTKENNNSEKVYISTKSDKIFPTTSEIKYNSTDEKVTETKTRKKYDDSEVFLGTAVGYHVLGPIGAYGAYNYLNSQTESEKITKIVKKESKDFVEYNLSDEFFEFVHFDFEDLPEDLRLKKNLNCKVLTVKEYLEKINHENKEKFEIEKKVKTVNNQEVHEKSENGQERGLE